MTWLGHCRAGEGQGNARVADSARTALAGNTVVAAAATDAWEACRAKGRSDQYAALLPIYERVLGPEHPDTLAIPANLVYWTGMAGDRARARDQLTALLPIRERILGPEHPDTLTTRTSLGDGTPERHTHLTCESLHRTDRYCRVAGLDGRSAQVYFLAFLNPSRGQPEPALTARLAYLCHRR